MGVDTSCWSHLADSAGHSIGELACCFVAEGVKVDIVLSILTT